MPARLVYAPKAWVYVKNSNNRILDLSPFVTAGNVSRKLEQVSTAEVTLRNPGKRFTTPSQGVAFHPQDPITIFLERIPGFPVRVFTGYLDETPYYQLFPGSITITASCTLKRLLYTFFDPSLPYVIAFLEQYGWINTGQGSLISQSSFNTQAVGATQTDVKQGATPFGTLQDGSIGKLLWATLYNIGQWQDSNIWIEPLPSGANGIAARMARLMTSLEADNAQAAHELQTFLTAVVGASAQGNGGGNNTSGTLAMGRFASNANITVKGSPATQDQINILNTALSAAAAVQAPTRVAIALVETLIVENSVSNPNPGNPGDRGAFSMIDSTVQSLGINPYDVGAVSTAFLTRTQGGATGGAIGWAQANPSAHPYQIAQAVQASGAGSASDGAANYGQFETEATHTVQSWSPGSASGQSTSTGASSGANSGTSPVSSAIQGIATGVAQSGTTTQRGATDQSGKAVGTSSRIQAMLAEGDAITAKHYHYSFGGGHEKVGQPSVHQGSESGGAAFLGFDCSGSSAAVLAAGGYIQDNTSIPASQNLPGLVTDTSPGVGIGDPSVTLYTNSAHAYLVITSQGHTRYFSTHGSNPGGGAGWQPGTGGFDGTGFSAVHLNGLTQANTAPDLTPLLNGQGVAGDTANVGSAATNLLNSSSAQAFVAQIDFPSIEEQVTAIALGGQHKGLMHDQNLLPFVQQLTQGSMRSFQSLPNGDFFAFYPDYFGEMGHHDPYWFIDDLEILDGTIKLNDDALATHVFAVGDNTWPVNNELLNMLFSAGTISIFNAFLDSSILDTSKQAKANTVGGLADVMTTREATEFLKRYGARPLVTNYPMVRSPIYEMLLAYQQFMMSWSNQFKSNFTFTFMPELYPGGKVGFPSHGLQMYINSVTHSWDYSEGGFTTTAELSAPAILQMSAAQKNQFGSPVVNSDLPPNMVSALVEPIRGSTQSPQPTVQLGISSVAEALQSGLGF